MREVLEKLNNIESANKKDKKIALLSEYLRSDQLFKDVVVMASSGTMHFNIKKLPIINQHDRINLGREETISELFKHLNYLTTVSGANKKDKEWIAKLATNLDCGLIVVGRILSGKLRCGASSTSINKAWPGLIYNIPYMRCSTESKIDNIIYESIVDGKLVKHGAYYDEKLDGMFFNVLVDGSKVTYRSRNGKKYCVENEKLDNAFIKRSNGFNVVYTGEGRILRNGKILDRKAGNGIITKILKGTAKKEDHNDLFITIWEALPMKDFWNGKCNVPLIRRYNSKFFEGLTPNHGLIRIPFRKIVYSQEEALDLANDFIENGGEGGVLKNLYSIWKNGTSPFWIKLKAVVDCEMVIIGWEYGEIDSKYEGCMGKVHYESNDGLIKVAVGGGFSDNQRYENWDEKIGLISTIRFSEMIGSKTKVSKSLFLPRFVEHRCDKDTADDFETIKRLIAEARKKSDDK